MNCLIDLCNSQNPHGCCNPDSCLFIIWSAPALLITCPIWSVYLIGRDSLNFCFDAKDWSDKNRNNYEVIE